MGNGGDRLAGLVGNAGARRLGNLRQLHERQFVVHHQHLCRAGRFDVDGGGVPRGHRGQRQGADDPQRGQRLHPVGNDHGRRGQLDVQIPEALHRYDDEQQGAGGRGGRRLHELRGAGAVHDQRSAGVHGRGREHRREFHRGDHQHRQFGANLRRRHRMDALFGGRGRGAGVRRESGAAGRDHGSGHGVHGERDGQSGADARPAIADGLGGLQLRGGDGRVELHAAGRRPWRADLHLHGQQQRRRGDANRRRGRDQCARDRAGIRRQSRPGERDRDRGDGVHGFGDGRSDAGAVAGRRDGFGGLQLRGGNGPVELHAAGRGRGRTNLHLRRQQRRRRGVADRQRDGGFRSGQCSGGQRDKHRHEFLHGQLDGLHGRLELPSAGGDGQPLHRRRQRQQRADRFGRKRRRVQRLGLCERGEQRGHLPQAGGDHGAGGGQSRVLDAGACGGHRRVLRGDFRRGLRERTVAFLLAGRRDQLGGLRHQHRRHQFDLCDGAAPGAAVRRAGPGKRADQVALRRGDGRHGLASAVLDNRRSPGGGRFAPGGPDACGADHRHDGIGPGNDLLHSRAQTGRRMVRHRFGDDRELRADGAGVRRQSGAAGRDHGSGHGVHGERDGQSGADARPAIADGLGGLQLRGGDGRVELHAAGRRPWRADLHLHGQQQRRRGDADRRRGRDQCARDRAGIRRQSGAAGRDDGGGAGVHGLGDGRSDAGALAGKRDGFGGLQLRGGNGPVELHAAARGRGRTNLYLCGQQQRGRGAADR